MRGVEGKDFEAGRYEGLCSKELCRGCIQG